MSRTGDATDDGLLEVAANLRYILVRLGRSLRRETASDLTPLQISALTTLEDEGPQRIKTLAAREGVDPSVATRVVAHLDEAGLLERTDDPDDKRACVVGLTEAGREAVARHFRGSATALTSRLAHLDDGDLELVVRALPALEKLARDHEVAAASPR